MHTSIYLSIYHIPIYHSAMYISLLYVCIFAYIFLSFFLSSPSPASLTSFCLLHVFFCPFRQLYLRPPSLQSGWSSSQCPFLFSLGTIFFLLPFASPVLTQHHSPLSLSLLYQILYRKFILLSVKCQVHLGYALFLLRVHLVLLFPITAPHPLTHTLIT